MGIFFNKKPVKATYEERLATLEIEFSKVKREVISCVMDIDTLRDKVLRKIQKKRKDNEEEVEGVAQEDGFNSIRKLNNSPTNKVL